jgi:hypothetical protein
MEFKLQAMKKFFIKMDYWFDFRSNTYYFNCDSFEIG